MGYYKTTLKDYATNNNESQLNEAHFKQMINFLNEYLPCFQLYGYTSTGQPMRLISADSPMEFMALDTLVRECLAEELTDDYIEEEIGYEDEDGEFGGGL
jgi:hypothetical protein